MSRIKDKLGVTIHKNMSLKKMTEVWNTKVSQDIKDIYPELNQLMITATTQVVTTDLATTVAETAQQAYDTAKATFQAAVDALAQAAGAARAAAEEAVEDANEAVKSLVEEQEDTESEPPNVKHQIVDELKTIENS